ncbi:hypothetical protein FACS1894145_5820 [Bacteroidia bacterium]|nr:hypothetical protein FACS1894145_5820 [Bacteroidia bacterium]
MNDLSKYALKSFSNFEELFSQISPKKLFEYREAVFNICRELKPGQIYNIAESVRIENQEVFVKCVCSYIMIHGADCNVLFTDDYASVKGVKSFNEEHQRLEEYTEQVRQMKKSNIYEKK